MAEDGEADACQHDRRASGGDHRLDVVKEVCFRNGGSNVGRIGQRRHLIAEGRAGDDRARGERRVDAKAHADAHQRNANGARGGPGRARGHRRDDAGDHGREQEPAGVDELQAPENDHGNGAAGDPGAHQSADAVKDDQRGDEQLAAVQDRFFNVLVGAAGELEQEDRKAHADHHCDVELLAGDEDRAAHGRDQKCHRGKCHP